MTKTRTPKKRTSSESDGAVSFKRTEDVIEFPCPRCGKTAYFYPRTRIAGCLLHGYLLYTEIPPEIRKRRIGRRVK